MEDFSHIPDEALAKTVLTEIVFRDLDNGGFSYWRSRISRLEMSAGKLLPSNERYNIKWEESVIAHIKTRIAALWQNFKGNITDEDVAKMLEGVEIERIAESRDIKEGGLFSLVQTAEQNIAAIFRNGTVPYDQIDIKNITNEHLSKLLLMEIIENPKACREELGHGYWLSLQAWVQMTAALLEWPCISPRENNQGDELLAEYIKRWWIK